MIIVLGLVVFLLVLLPILALIVRMITIDNERTNRPK